MFSWTAGTGAAGYTLWLGSTGVGSNNISDRRETATSDSFAGLPTNGETIYVRLYTNFNGTEAHTDYTYTAAQKAALISPAGSLLQGPAILFRWTEGNGASGYKILVGNRGAGSSNLIDSGQSTVRSAVIGKLPAKGETIYARLSTDFNGVEAYTDYIFEARKGSRLIDPAFTPLRRGR